MRFAAIPDELVPEGSRKYDFGPPPGHEATTGHLDVLVDPDPEYVRRYTFLVEFDDADLEALTRTRRAWVGQVGSVLQPVFCAGVVRPSDPARPATESAPTADRAVEG